MAGVKVNLTDNETLLYAKIFKSIKTRSDHQWEIVEDQNV